MWEWVCWIDSEGSQYGEDLFLKVLFHPLLFATGQFVIAAEQNFRLFETGDDLLFPAVVLVGHQSFDHKLNAAKLLFRSEPIRASFIRARFNLLE